MTKILIVIFVLTYTVCGTDDTRALTFCYSQGTGDEIHGLFVTMERKTQLRLFSNGTDDGCRLQHEDGPVSDDLSWVDAARIVGICRDSVTGRDWAMVHWSAGQYFDFGFWSVDTVSQAVELEYEEAWTEWGLEGNRYGEFEANGLCLARERMAGQSLLNEAILSLRVNDSSDTGERDETQFDIPVGARMQLDTKVITEEEVQRWLRDLISVRPKVVKFEGARYSDKSSRDSWLVIQVLGTRFYNASGVVLVLDRVENEWRAIYDVLSGGSKRLNFPMYNMFVEGDKLFAKLCTDCDGWGYYGDFGINLRTHQVTRLATMQPAGNDEGNRTIQNLDQELEESQ